LSSVVSPSRVPASRSCCRTQLRSVSVVQPIFPAIDCIAAHSESCSSRCVSTIRTARSRTSAENLFGLPMAPILSRVGASGKLGAVQFDHASALGEAETSVYNEQPPMVSIEPCDTIPLVNLTRLASDASLFVFDIGGGGPIVKEIKGTFTACDQIVVASSE
jgi:hypothetical protein